MANITQSVDGRAWIQIPSVWISIFQYSLLQSLQMQPSWNLRSLSQLPLHLDPAFLSSFMLPLTSWCSMLRSHGTSPNPSSLCSQSCHQMLVDILCTCFPFLPGKLPSLLWSQRGLPNSSGLSKFLSAFIHTCFILRCVMGLFSTGSCYSVSPTPKLLKGRNPILFSTESS